MLDIHNVPNKTDIFTVGGCNGIEDARIGYKIEFI
jgi:hypothetical protein